MIGGIFSITLINVLPITFAIPTTASAKTLIAGEASFKAKPIPITAAVKAANPNNARGFAKVITAIPSDLIPIANPFIPAPTPAAPPPTRPANIPNMPPFFFLPSSGSTSSPPGIAPISSSSLPSVREAGSPLP